MTRTTSQTGSAFFLILIAIFLLAGLTFALLQGNRAGLSSLTAEQAQLAAQEIINYGDSVEKAVAKIRMRGCTATQISFANQVLSGYTNAAAPSDGTCTLFLPAGGALNYKDYSRGSSWVFNAQGRVLGAGDDCTNATCSDLVAILPGIQREVCEKIEKILHNTTTVSQDETNMDIASKFTGTYNYNVNHSIGVTNTALEIYEKPSGCLQGNLDGSGANISTQYIFYQTLIAR